MTNIIVNYCCKGVLLHTKMLKGAKAEETIGFFATILSLMTFQVPQPISGRVNRAYMLLKR